MVQWIGYKNLFYERYLNIFVELLVVEKEIDSFMQAQIRSGYFV